MEGDGIWLIRIGIGSHLCGVLREGNERPQLHCYDKVTVPAAHIGTSSIICVAPSLPTVIITSPSVFVEKPASEYLK